LLELLDEAQGIQDLLSERQRTNPSEVSRIYEKLILEGNVSQANNFLDQQATQGGILKMTEEIKTKLETLHPEPAPTDPAYLAKGTPPVVKSEIFESLTAKSIKEASLHTTGAHEISGGEAQHHLKMLWSSVWKVG
jgi:hypothetical protein